MITDTQHVNIPEGGQILSVDNQWGELFLWALVDLKQTRVTRTIDIYGTGHSIPNLPRKHLGTVVVDSFVWHIFEQGV